MKANTATKQPKPSCAKKRWIERIWGALPFIFLIVLVLIIAIFFQRTQIKKERIAAEKSAGLAQEQTAVNVVTLDIAPSPIRDRINLPGVAAPWIQLKVLSEVKGKVLKKSVKEGEHIKKGDIIARLDDRNFKNDFLSIKSSHNAAKASLNRIEKLQKIGSSTQARLDETFARVDNLEAAMANAALDLERCVIRSPLSGIVNRLFIEEGQYLSDAAPVADIIQINRVKVKVGIPESDVDAVRHLNVFEVKIDALGGKTFRAKKHFLSNTADSMARLYNLNLVIENVTKEILPDMFARVEIVKKEILNGISVPIYAVINRSKEKIVYIVNDKHVRTRKVELGLLDGWRVQIKSGLKKGDRVIVVGQRNVNPGQEVRIVRSIKDMEDLMK